MAGYNSDLPAGRSGTLCEFQQLTMKWRTRFASD
jgi:hypothetical protein